MINILAGLPVFVQNKILALSKLSSVADLRVFYIGGYWRGSNDMVAQMLQGLKTIGISVFEFNTDEHSDALDTDGRPYDRGTNGPVWLVKNKLFPLILRFRPHVIVCNAGGLSFRAEDVADLRRLGIKLFGAALSDPDVYANSTSKIVENFDVFYSNDKTSVELYKNSGVQSFQLPIATNDLFFHPVPSRPEYVCEVLHLGAAHLDRIEPVKALVEHFDVHVYGENWEKHGVTNRGVILGEDTLSALNSARIAVVFSRTPSGRQTVKVGIFDFLAAGCLVATEDFPEIHQYFEAGKEIILFNDTEDMLEKIRYFLDHPEKADAICEAGRRKVLDNFTWTKVWPKILTPILRANGRFEKLD
jgi:spore maturation protein CgeB